MKSRSIGPRSRDRTVTKHLIYQDNSAINDIKRAILSEVVLAQARLSPQGALRWVTACGGAGEDIIYSTAASEAGEVAATGWFEGEFACQTQGVTSAGGKDAMLLSLDGEGQAIALSRFGDGDHDQGRALASLPNRRWIVGGVFRISLNYGEKSLIQAPAVAPPRRADGFLLLTQLR